MTRRLFTIIVFAVLILGTVPCFAGWGPWTKMGGSYQNDPALCDELFTFKKAYVAARGTDGAIWMRTWDGTKWWPAFSLGGRVKSSPSLVCTPERIDVFAWGMDNNINQNTLTIATQRWSGWKPIPSGTVASGPAAVWRANGFQVFARGYGGTLKMTTNIFGRWGPWIDLGGNFVGEPGAASVHAWTVPNAQVVVRAPDTLLWQLDVSGDPTRPDFHWRNLHRNTYGNPEIAVDHTLSYSRTDWFTTNPRRTVDHRYRLDEWENLGGVMAGYSGVAATWTKKNQLLLVIRGPDNALYHRVFNR